MPDATNLFIQDADEFCRLVIDVEGPFGPCELKTVEDVENLLKQFNDKLNDVLNERENLRDQLVGIALTLSNIERARQEGFKAGYEAAMLENASWNLD